jgi:5-methylcytosine-specific restriction enzyme subunit McrC
VSEAFIHIAMEEWETREPDRGSGLEGIFLQTWEDRAIASRLASEGLLAVTELRTGLRIQSFSYVGKIRLGRIEITVRPKLEGSSLLNLLQYAYGFRRLKLLPEAALRLDQSGFADLLVSQLNTEVNELVARGLHRTYIPTRDWLASPRGRIDLGRLGAQGGIVTACLPCTHHPRIEDTILNQVLYAGLDLAGTVAGDLHLRRESERLAALFAEYVSPLQLSHEVLNHSFRKLNRLTAAYESAITLVSLLWKALRVTLTEGRERHSLPGFLFDMNRFFQALLSRFLRENLPQYSVREEFRLKGMIQFLPGFNPRKSPPIIPRPDFVVLQGNRPMAILDAKYRDLWEKALPGEMFYQLAIYAAIHQQHSATILYPTTDKGAKEARIAINDTVYGRPVALVCLRPVVLSTLEGHVMADHTANAQRRRSAYAENLVVGFSSSLAEASTP